MTTDVSISILSSGTTTKQFPLVRSLLHSNLNLSLHSIQLLLYGFFDPAVFFHSATYHDKIEIVM